MRGQTERKMRTYFSAFIGFMLLLGSGHPSANNGVLPNQMLSTGSEPISWGSAGWNSPGWNSTIWDN